MKNRDNTGRNRPVGWFVAADPTRGALTRKLDPAGTVVVYAVLVAVMDVCENWVPRLATDLVAAALLYLFVDFLGWLNRRVSRDENAFRRNRTWLRLLAVVLLASMILLLAMQVTPPPINRN